MSDDNFIHYTHTHIHIYIIPINKEEEKDFQLEIGSYCFATEDIAKDSKVDT